MAWHGIVWYGMVWYGNALALPTTGGINAYGDGGMWEDESVAVLETLVAHLHSVHLFRFDSGCRWKSLFKCIFRRTLYTYSEPNAGQCTLLRSRLRLAGRSRRQATKRLKIFQVGDFSSVRAPILGPRETGRRVAVVRCVDWMCCGSTVSA